MKKPKLISFDFDGTICPETGAGFFFEKNLRKNLAEIFGTNALTDNRRNAIKENLEKENWETIKKTSFSKTIESLKIPEQISESIKELSKNNNLIIFTAATKSYTEKILKNNNLQKFFKKIYSSRDDFNSITKESWMFKKIAKTHNLNPSECLHIGDSIQRDILPAKKAGFSSQLIAHNEEKTISFEELQKQFTI